MGPSPPLLSPGGSEQHDPGRARDLLWCQQPVQQCREHDHHSLHQGVLLWETGRGEGGGEFRAPLHREGLGVGAGMSQSWV